MTDNAALLAEYRSGATIRQLAQREGISGQAMYSRLALAKRTEVKVAPDDLDPDDDPEDDRSGSVGQGRRILPPGHPISWDAVLVNNPSVAGMAFIPLAKYR